MTDRSTGSPEDQPVPPDTDETEDTVPTEAGLAEQETMAEAVAMGVGPGEDEEAVEPNELAATAELDEPGAATEPIEPAGEPDAGDAEDLGEPGGEAASDLDAEDLEAAATAAEAEAEADADELVETVVVAEDVEPLAAPAGAAARPAAKAPTSARAGGRTALEVDPALRIRDRASQVFVALTVLVFVAIFANAMLFGVNGALNAPPAPSPSASPLSSGSPAPSGSAAPTTTAGPSAS
ncbi:MAG: hypothetical protein ACAH65_00570 [Chloroflexota bacterium]